MFHLNTTRNITASISFVSKYGAHVNTSMNLNNLLLFWSSFLLRTNGLGQPTVGWSAQFLQTPNWSSCCISLLRVAGWPIQILATMHNLQHDTVSNVSTVQCVHNVSKVQTVRSLDLRRICSANVNRNSAGHGAGVSFPVQIQPGDAATAGLDSGTGSSPQLGLVFTECGCCCCSSSV